LTSDLPAHCCADAHFAEQDLNHRSRLAGYERNSGVHAVQSQAMKANKTKGIS